MTATSPARRAAITFLAKSLEASARAASWTKTNSASGEIAARPMRTLSLRVDPPVTTVARSAAKSRIADSYPEGAVMTISSTTAERDASACSIRVRSPSQISALGIGLPKRSPLPAAAMMAAIMGTSCVRKQEPHQELWLPYLHLCAQQVLALRQESALP